MSADLDVLAARRFAAAFLADIAKTLGADPPTTTRTVAQRMRVRAWYKDVAVDLLFVYSPKLEPWVGIVDLDLEVFREQCELRGFVRDPWSDLPPDVQRAVGGRPVVFEDPEQERRLLRALRSFARREAA